ncbi:MAG: hypothetical protein SFV54_04410 [Bryobacteraceae bacterium]|nr:hypothetical protein [Bryobacteraceae bacterium]
MSLTIGEYRAEHFEPLKGEVFEFVGGSGERLRMELLEVRRGPGRTQWREPFSLLFALQSEWGKSSGTLTLRRDGFEDTGWFVSRVSVLGGDPGIRYCEAVFT